MKEKVEKKTKTDRLKTVMKHLEFSSNNISKSISRKLAIKLPCLWSQRHLMKNM